MSSVDRFKVFVDRAKSLLQAGPSPRLAGQIEAFKSLACRGRELVIGPARAAFAKLERQLATLADVMLDREMDVLRVAGLTWAEDPYTELIAWTLDPRVHRQSALAVQRAWLQALKIPEASSFSEPVVPRTQLWIDGEIPDLVLRYQDFVVVVEAKTGTEEHTTRSGRYQTESYPLAVRAALGCGDIPLHVVFLTIDRVIPANRKAIPTTYLAFSLVLARLLKHGQLSAEVASVYRIVASHFAQCAVPGGVEIAPLLKDLAATVDDTTILRHLPVIQQIETLLEGHDDDV